MDPKQIPKTGVHLSDKVTWDIAVPVNDDSTSEQEHPQRFVVPLPGH